MKIAVFSSKSYDIEYFNFVNSSYNYEIEYFDALLSIKTARLASGFDIVCAFVNDKLNAATLQKLADFDINFIALRCAGFNNVDLEAAHELGITIARVPSYSPHAVAEHAIALIMALNRKTHKAYNRVRDGNFSLERLVGFDLVNKVVGVIGTGLIGSTFARIMMGFGCQIIATDPYPDKELQSSGVIYSELEKLLMQSDIVSLHCPLTPSTHQLINNDTLGKMKQGSMLINTSRGKLINTHNVIDAIRAKHLAYLGIDVYAEEENLFFRDLSERIIDDEIIMQLMTFPNVLITAHQAFLTREALSEIATTTLRNISLYSKGESNINIVSKEHLL